MIDGEQQYEQASPDVAFFAGDQWNETRTFKAYCPSSLNRTRWYAIQQAKDNEKNGLRSITWLVAGGCWYQPQHCTKLECPSQWRDRTAWTDWNIIQLFIAVVVKMFEILKLQLHLCRSAQSFIAPFVSHYQHFCNSTTCTVINSSF